MSSNSYSDFLLALFSTELEIREYNRGNYKLLDSLLSLDFKTKFFRNLLQEQRYSLVVLPSDKKKYLEMFKNINQSLQLSINTELQKLSKDYILENIKSLKEDYKETRTKVTELHLDQRNKYPFTLRYKLEYIEYLLEILSPLTFNFSKNIA